VFCSVLEAGCWMLDVKDVILRDLCREGGAWLAEGVVRFETMFTIREFI
jgi:hypothetical protein